MDKIKLAIVGLGHVAGYQLRALKEVGHFQLVAVCDLDESKKTQFPDKVPFFTDYRDMLNSINMDAVLVSVPNKEHYKVAKDILESGKNVLLEKPATLNLEEFKSLISIAKAKKLTFVIAFHASFARDLQWFLENYRTKLYKELGKITGFRCGFYDPYIVDGVLLKNAESLNGSWIDSGINALSVVDKLVDNLTVEEVFLTHVPQYNCTEIQGSVNFTFSVDEKDKIGRGTIDTNWTLNLNCKITRLFFADKRKEIVLHHSKQQVLLIDNYGSVKLLRDCSNGKERLVNHYIGVLRDFYSHLMSKTDNLERALRLHEMLLKPYNMQGGPTLCH